jgi:hypothetical protein
VCPYPSQDSHVSQVGAWELLVELLCMIAMVVEGAR